MGIPGLYLKPFHAYFYSTHNCLSFECNIVCYGWRLKTFGEPRSQLGQIFHFYLQYSKCSNLLTFLSLFVFYLWFPFICVMGSCPDLEQNFCVPRDPWVQVPILNIIFFFLVSFPFIWVLYWFLDAKSQFSRALCRPTGTNLFTFLYLFVFYLWFLLIWALYCLFGSLGPHGNGKTKLIFFQTPCIRPQRHENNFTSFRVSRPIARMP